MSTEMSKSALLGQLRDEGFSAMVVNRLQSLLDDVFNGNVEAFVNASETQLLSAYAKTHPGGYLKSLGKETYKAHERMRQLEEENERAGESDTSAHERMRQLYWTFKKDAAALAKETAKAEAAEAAKREAAKNEALERMVEFEPLLSAITALSTLKLKSASLSQILAMYDMAKKGGAQ